MLLNRAQNIRILPGDPFISSVRFLQNAWTSLSIAQYPSGQNFTQIGTPVLSSLVQHDGLDTLLLDGSNALTLNGTGSTLTINNTTDFCLEAWLRCTGSGSQNSFFSKRDGSSAEEFSFHLTSAGVLQFATFRSGAVENQLDSNSALSFSTWYHVAAVRNGTTLTMYVDGVAQTDVETQVNLPSTNTQVVGLGQDAFNTSRRFKGNFGPMRITHGAARYTANFTPPRLFPTY